MENVGYASLQIIPSMKGFESKLSSGTSGPLSSAGSKGGRLFGNSAGKSITSTVSAHAKKAAYLGAAAFAAVGAAAFKLGKDSIAEARESQKVGAITTQVIKSTGGAAKVTAGQVGDLSMALSNKAGIDDEVIQRGANMLLTFKGIRNEAGKNNKIFDQSVGVTTDLAAAMAGGKGGDLDLKAASIQVGKALNDPVKGVTALQKVGVSFTNVQRAQIKALVEGGDANAAMATGLIQTSTEFTTLLKGQNGDLSKTVAILTHDLTPAQKKTYDMYAEGGHTLEAQKRILKELNSEFGGTAAAQATMGEKVKVAWGNVEEQLGTALLPLVDKAERAFLKKGVPAIQGWASAFQKDGVPAIKHFYREAKPVAEDVLPAVFDLLKAGKPVLKVTAGLVGDLADAFTKIPKWAQVAIAGGLLAGKMGGFKIAGGLLGGSKGGVLGGIASKAAPLPVIVMNKGFTSDLSSGGRKGSSSSYVDGGNEDRRRRRRKAGATGAALIAGVVGDELTGGKISEILTHPLRELGKEMAFPFTQGAQDAFKGLDKSQAFLLNRAKETGSLYHGGSITLQDRQLPGAASFPQITQPPVITPKVSTKEIDAAFKKMTAFNAVMGTADNKDMRPNLDIPRLAQTSKALGEFISREITAGKPIMPYINTSSIERALGQVRTLNAELQRAAIASRGVDNGVTYQHGGQSGSSVDGRVAAHFGDR